MTAGLTVATIAVTVLDDDVAEGQEAFAVILSGATGATIADGEGIGTIRDDDLPAVSVSFGAASYQVVEGESVEVAVVLAPAVSRSVTVPLIHLPGEGATEADYSGVPEALVFESLETRRTFRILATADAETEEGESVVLGFGTLPAGVTAGATATSTVSLEDSGFSGRRVTKRWLQRFGGTAASHAIDAISERLRCARYHYSLDATSVHLPGRWKCNPWFQRRASLAINGLVIEGLRQDAPAASGIRWIRGPSHGWTERLGGHLDRRTHDLRALGAAEVLTGTSFHLSTGPEDGPPGLSVWGRGSFSQVKGREEDISFAGDVASATFGADYSAARVLGGVAVSYSDGDGELSQFHSGRKVSSTLTSVYPYVRLAVNERVSVWGAVGLGSGSMRLPTSDGESNRTSIAMRVGAAGSRTEVRTPRRPGDLALALKSETVLLRIRSDETPEIDATKTDTNRMRLMLEGASDHALDETGHVSPFFEIGLRRDGGDGDPGFGVEVGGGVRYTRPEIGLTAEFGARGLLCALRRRLPRMGGLGLGPLRSVPRFAARPVVLALVVARTDGSQRPGSAVAPRDGGRLAVGSPRVLRPVHRCRGRLRVPNPGRCRDRDPLGRGIAVRAPADPAARLPCPNRRVRNGGGGPDAPAGHFRRRHCALRDHGPALRTMTPARRPATTNWASCRASAGGCSNQR